MHRIQSGGQAKVRKSKTWWRESDDLEPEPPQNLEFCWLCSSVYRVAEADLSG
jgi:hypothetical protein